MKRGCYPSGLDGSRPADADATGSVGAVSLISNAVGRKDRADANLVFNQSLGLSAAGTLFTLIAGCLLARSYMRSVAADDAVIEAGTTYLFWFMPALALQFVALVMGSALRGTGIVRPTVIVQTTTVMINMLLAPVLITGWGTGLALGVAGAGLASTIAVVIGVAMMWIYFHRYEHYVAINSALWRPQLAQWKRILGIGLPAGGEFAIIFLNMAAIYFALRHFGAAAQAGFGIGSRLLGLIHMPGISIALAAGAIVGQNFGAGNCERVRRTFETVLAAGILPRRLYRRRGDNRGRRAVPAHGLAQQCRARGEFRLLKHVSGTGQHQAGAARLRRTAADQYGAPDLSIRDARFPYRTRLVFVDRNDDAASGIELVVAATGVQEAASAACEMKRRMTP